MATKRGWFLAPKTKTKLKVPDSTKAEVMEKAEDFINKKLKPRYLKSKEVDSEFNTLVEISSKWHQNYFYFQGEYKCNSPERIADSFITKFARLEYQGNDRFNLSYMRHTGQWFEISNNLSLKEALKEIEGPHFMLC